MLNGFVTANPNPPSISNTNVVRDEGSALTALTITADLSAIVDLKEAGVITRSDAVACWSSTKWKSLSSHQM
jgi:hypothetical protein